MTRILRRGYPWLTQNCARLSESYSCTLPAPAIRCAALNSPCGRVRHTKFRKLAAGLLPREALSPVWTDYELLDTGAGRKLERFGSVTLVRPEPQADWPTSLPEKSWNAAH